MRLISLQVLICASSTQVKEYWLSPCIDAHELKIQILINLEKKLSQQENW